MRPRRVRPAELEEVAYLDLCPGALELGLYAIENLARFREVLAKPIRARDLGAQDQSIVARRRSQRGPKALFALRGIGEIPHGFEIDRHDGACESDEQR